MDYSAALQGNTFCFMTSGNVLNCDTAFVPQSLFCGFISIFLSLIVQLNTYLNFEIWLILYRQF